MKNCFLIIILIISLSGCVKAKYVPVESTKTEYRDQVVRDSIYLKDSIHIHAKGDTVFLEKFRYLYRDKIIKDSVFINDTIRVPYPVKGDTIISYKRDFIWWAGLVLIIALVVYITIRITKRIK